MQDKGWIPAIGIVTMATPEEITEEFQHRVPALDIQLLRQVHGGLHIAARAWVQVLQNQAMLGLRYARPLGARFSTSVGGDFSAWKGHLLVEDLDTDASGWSAYPNLSLGYRAGQDVLITLKGEAVLHLDHRVRVGEIEITRDVRRFNGMAWSLYVEQPFFGKHHLALGFTARYTEFYWATWALFNTYERKLLYRHITIAFIP